MVRFIELHKKPKFMRIAVECPHCHESLMDTKHPIKKMPSISILCKLPNEFGNKENIIHLSGYYGDYIKEIPFDMPDGIIGTFFCPKCRHELTREDSCTVCEAPMVEIHLAKGGMLEFCMDAYKRNLHQRPTDKLFKGSLLFCARRGCPNHMIDFQKQDTSLMAFYEAYAPFLED